MNDEVGLPHLREIILFLGLSGIIIPLLKRFKINPVLGFLTVGVVLGPYGLGALKNDYPILATLTFSRLEVINVFAEIGVIFLLFNIGLHLSLERLWSLRRWVFGAGVLQMFVTIVTMGALLLMIGKNIQIAFISGAILAFSSTAIVVQLMQQNAQMNTPMGRAVFSILLLQDLAVVPLLLLLETFGQKDTSLTLSILIAGGKAIVAFTTIYWVGKKMVRPLFHEFADTKEPESFVALILLMALGIAAITHFVGLSMALGALLAGLLLAETEFRHEIEIIIKPFSGLLMGLFFFSMGMNINMPGVLAEPWLMIGLALLVYTIKSIIAGLILKNFGLSRGASVEGGVLLGQGSEFAFIALGIALAHGVFAQAEAERFAIVLSLSLLMTPILSALTYRLHNHWRNQEVLREMSMKHQQDSDVPHPVDKEEVVSASTQDWHNHVVILGYGRVGQVLAKLLYHNSIPFVAIDSNARHSSFFYKHGLPVFFGNEQHPEMLRAFNLDRAMCAVLTMNNRDGSLKVVEVIRREYPNLAIFARAHDEAHGRDLLAAGAKEVILETFEASLQLTQTVLRASGVSLEDLQKIITQEREARIEGIAPHHMSQGKREGVRSKTKHSTLIPEPLTTLQEIHNQASGTPLESPLNGKTSPIHAVD